MRVCARVRVRAMVRVIVRVRVRGKYEVMPTHQPLDTLFDRLPAKTFKVRVRVRWGRG